MKKSLSLLFAAASFFGTASANDITVRRGVAEPQSLIQAAVEKTTPAEFKSQMLMENSEVVARARASFNAFKERSAYKFSADKSRVLPAASSSAKAAAETEFHLGERVMVGTSLFDGTKSTWYCNIVQLNHPDSIALVGFPLHEYETEGFMFVAGRVNASRNIAIFAQQPIAEVAEGGTVIFDGINVSSNGSVSLMGSARATIEASGVYTFNSAWGTLVANSSEGMFEAWQTGMQLTPSKYVADTYAVPNAALFQMPTIEFNLAYSSLVGPSNVDVRFAVSNPSEIASYKWDYTMFDNSVGAWAQQPTVTGTELVYPAAYSAVYELPKLTKTVDGVNSVYQMGKEGFFQPYDVTPMYQQSGYSYSNYDNSGNLTDFSGLSNADLDMKLSYGIIAQNSQTGEYAYMYGTGCDKADLGLPNGQSAVLTRFDKPTSALSFAAVDIMLDTLIAPVNVPFYCHIVRISEELQNGFPVYRDTIAVAEAYLTDAYTPEGAFTWLQFTEFYAEDEFGMSSKLDYITMIDPFVVEISGFNVPGVQFGAMTEAFVKDSHTCKSYFRAKISEDESIYSWGNDAPNMYISLRDAAYGYIRPDKSRIDASAAGGEYTVRIEPLYNLVEPVLEPGEESLPEWLFLEQDEHYSSTEWYSDVKIFVDELPKGIEGRYYRLMLGCYGGREAVRIFQGNTTGLTGVGEFTGNTAKFAGNKLIVDVASATTASIYNVAGKLVGSYSVAGVSSIDASSYADGIYVVKFADGKAVKLVK